MIERLYNDAVKKLSDGDEELAYIYLYRYREGCRTMRKRDQGLFNSSVEPKIVKKAEEKLRQTAKSLANRYRYRYVCTIKNTLASATFSSKSPVHLEPRENDTKENKVSSGKLKNSLDRCKDNLCHCQYETSTISEKDKHTPGVTNNDKDALNYVPNREFSSESFRVDLGDGNHQWVEIF